MKVGHYLFEDISRGGHGGGGERDEWHWQGRWIYICGHGMRSSLGTGDKISRVKFNLDLILTVSASHPAPSLACCARPQVQAGAGETRCVLGEGHGSRLTGPPKMGCQASCFNNRRVQLGTSNSQAYLVAVPGLGVPI